MNISVEPNNSAFIPERVGKSVTAELIWKWGLTSDSKWGCCMGGEGGENTFSQ